jgi:hypothetical protein
MAKKQAKKGGAGASRRTVQRSISLSPAQWRRLDAFGDITQWGRSGVTAQALDLLVDISVPLAQRVAALKRTSVGSTLRARVRAAIESAVADVEASSLTDPWAEFDAALALAGPDIDRSGVLALPEAELMDLADRVTRESRRERRGAKSRA